MIFCQKYWLHKTEILHKILPHPVSTPMLGKKCVHQSALQEAPEPPPPSQEQVEEEEEEEQEQEALQGLRPLRRRRRGGILRDRRGH